MAGLDHGEELRGGDARGVEKADVSGGDARDQEADTALPGDALLDVAQHSEELAPHVAEAQQAELHVLDFLPDGFRHPHHFHALAGADDHDEPPSSSRATRSAKNAWNARSCTSMRSSVPWALGHTSTQLSFTKGQKL